MLLLPSSRGVTALPKSGRAKRLFRKIGCRGSAPHLYLSMNDLADMLDLTKLNAKWEEDHGGTVERLGTR